uniref:EF-hand domain-containing protein n=2 Tax=Anopheles atroparvus TaxID=41427 RepID=A0A182IXC1_ANOAO
LPVISESTKTQTRTSKMTNLTEDQLVEFQEAFNLFDNRGDGKIQQQQIGECLRALGQNPTESDVKKFTMQLKPDERVSFEVFLPIYQAISKQRTAETADDFIEGLRHFDKDASGFISSAELRHLLTTLGEKLGDDEVEQLLQNQEDSQGNVNYEEFVRMVMSG